MTLDDFRDDIRCTAAIKQGHEIAIVARARIKVRLEFATPRNGRSTEAYNEKPEFENSMWMQRMSSHHQVHWRLAISLALALATTIVPAADDLAAQTTNDSRWQSHAEARLKAIYDRGDFRAKIHRPTWLSNSSGFVLEEVDPDTKKPAQWFYEVRSGERQAWNPDEQTPGSGGASQTSPITHRLESRDAKLLAIDQENQKETLSIVMLNGARTDLGWYLSRLTIPMCARDQYWCQVIHRTRRFSSIALQEWGKK
jgi:hypothetical protein